MPSILILGSGSDIAKAVAREFAVKRYTVYLAGRKTEQMVRLQRDLRARYMVEVQTFLFDAVRFHDHDGLIRSLPQMPDVVVYCAGVMSPQEDAFIQWEVAKNMIDVNYSAAVSILNGVAQQFSERSSGTIVGISSVAGDRGRASNFIYGSTKAAFSTYLSGLRAYLKRSNVHVVTVKPGYVDTKMTQGLNLPASLTASAELVAKKIYNAVTRKRDVVYVKPIWKWIMLVIKCIPESLFKHLKF